MSSSALHKSVSFDDTSEQEYSYESIGNTGDYSRYSVGSTAPPSSRQSLLRSGDHHLGVCVCLCNSQ